MITEINARTLEDWGACVDGIEKFVRANGKKTVPLSVALESNDVDDLVYFFIKNQKRFSDRQVFDVKMFLVECAWRALPNFEAEFPGEIRVRDCINATKKYLLDPTRRNRAAGRVARDAVYPSCIVGIGAAPVPSSVADCAYCACAAYGACADDDADYAAVDASDASEYAGEPEWQKARLKEIIKSWETK
jgi:hypothetical protein